MNKIKYYYGKCKDEKKKFSVDIKLNAIYSIIIYIAMALIVYYINQEKDYTKLENGFLITILFFLQLIFIILTDTLFRDKLMMKKLKIRNLRNIEMTTKVVTVFIINIVFVNIDYKIDVSIKYLLIVIAVFISLICNYRIHYKSILG